jgi:hypothetical protein
MKTNCYYPQYHFCNRTFKEKVVYDFRVVTEIIEWVSMPISSQHIIFGENSILLHQPHEYFYLLRNFCSPHSFVIRATISFCQVIIDILNGKKIAGRPFLKGNIFFLIPWEVVQLTCKVIPLGPYEPLQPSSELNHPTWFFYIPYRTFLIHCFLK